MFICNSGTPYKGCLIDSRDAAPWGSVDLAAAGMLSDQPYAAFVELELPRSKHNLELGTSFSLLLK